MGGLGQTEPRRQDGRLVEAHRPQKLLCHQIAAGIAGDHDSKEILFIQIVGLQQAGHAVEQGHQIGTDRIIVVGTEEQHGVAVPDGGEDLLRNRAAVKAGVVLGVMQTGLVGTSPAVRDRSVLQADFPGSDGGRKHPQQFPPHPDRVGADMIGGVQHQEPGA